MREFTSAWAREFAGECVREFRRKGVSECGLQSSRRRSPVLRVRVLVSPVRLLRAVVCLFLFFFFFFFFPSAFPSLFSRFFGNTLCVLTTRLFQRPLTQSCKLPLLPISCLAGGKRGGIEGASAQRRPLRSRLCCSFARSFAPSALTGTAAVPNSPDPRINLAATCAFGLN